MGFLDNKIALITGGGRGIGKATAQQFSNEGATVIIAEYDKASGEETAGAVNGHFAHCDYSPQLKERDLYIFPYDMRHCVYPFNGNGKRRTMPCNIDVDYDPIQNRGVM